MDYSKKVFGIGLSRTGTTTLHLILEQLGFKSLHFVGELLNEPQWDILNEYDAFTDSPIPLYYQQCDMRCPNSKFILTTRNREAWLASMKWMFSHGKIAWNWDATTHQYHQKFYGGQKYNRRRLEKFWDNYHMEIKNYFSERKNQLLIIDIDNGFNMREICDFLEVREQNIKIERSNTRVNVTYKQILIYYLKQYKILPNKSR